MENPKQKTSKGDKGTARTTLNANTAFTKKLSNLDGFALWITKRVGTIGFFVMIFLWTVGWLAWNSFAPEETRFDPFPGCILWLFISNMIQIFLMPLIMIGQNLQNEHSEAMAEADFEVNTKAEHEIEEILLRLDNLDKKIEKILEKLEKV